MGEITICKPQVVRVASRGAPACRLPDHRTIRQRHVHQPKPMRGTLSAQALRRSLLERIQDGHVEVREITFVPSGHGEAMNASRGGHHGVPHLGYRTGGALGRAYSRKTTPASMDKDL